MTSSAVDVGSRVAFLAAGLDGDARTGCRIAEDLLARGVDFERVVLDLLVATQEEIGRRWQFAECTVAEEHLVSGTVQRSLDVLAAATQRPPTRGRVVMATAEGDWHPLPAQMMAELLRCRGYDVAFLGTSAPPRDLAALVRKFEPFAVLVGCSLPLYYAGATRMADVAHASGVPVLMGGRALREPHRAARLGADGCASDVDAVVAVLESWAESPPAVDPEPTAVEEVAVLLDQACDGVAEKAFAALEEELPELRDYDRTRRQYTLDDIRSTVQFLSASRRVGDDSLFTEYVAWLRTVLTSRGVPTTALARSLTAIGRSLRGVDRTTADLVDRWTLLLPG